MATDKKVDKNKTTAGKNYIEVRFKNPKYAGAQTMSVYGGDDGSDVVYKNLAGKQSKITITPPKRRFDMDNVEQKHMWEWLQHHPFMTKEDSPFIIKDATAAAKDSVKQRRLRRTLELKVDEIALNPVKLEDLSRLVGIDPSKENAEVIIDRLYVLIDSETERMNKLLSDPERDVRELFYKALADKTFVYDDGVYLYNSTSMGATEEQAISWLKMNIRVLEAVRENYAQPIES